jgi:hypothetical protein
MYLDIEQLGARVSMMSEPHLTVSGERVHKLEAGETYGLRAHFVGVGPKRSANQYRKCR